MGDYENTITRTYEDGLIGDFSKIVKVREETDSKFQYDLMYGNFFDYKEDSIKINKIGTRGSFSLFCGKLAKYEAYDIFLRFMYEIFVKHEMYDIEGILADLKKVKLKTAEGETDLAGLSKEFLIYFETMRKFETKDKDYIEEVYNDAIEEAEKLYSKEQIREFMEKRESRVIDFPAMKKYLADFIAKRVYGYELDADAITKKDIDAIIEIVDRRIKEDVHIEEVEDMEDMEDVHIMNHNRNADEGVKYKYLGALLNIFKAAEDGDDDQKALCFYILENYVLDVFCDAVWTETKNKEVEVQVAILNVYMEFFYALTKYADEEIYCQLDETALLLDEMTSDSDRLLIMRGKDVWGKHEKIGVVFDKIIEYKGHILKKYLEKDTYSHLVLETIYILYCTNQKETAIQRLLKNYNDIREDERMSKKFFILLGKGILESKDIETASTLYGYFNFEVKRWQREQPVLCVYIKNMVEFLEEVKNYIKEHEVGRAEDGTTWYKFLYADGRIEGIIRNIKNQLENGEIPTENEFAGLIQIVDAFAHSDGIHLNALGLSKYEDDSKLRGMVPMELRAKGLACIEKSRAYKEVYYCEAMSELYQEANEFLQYHIFNLITETVSADVKKIVKIKKDYKKKHEKTEEEFAKELEDVCERLNDTLRTSSPVRSEVEIFLNRTERAFKKEYNIAGTDSLINKLQDSELRRMMQNYLVTSETVYRVLTENEKPQEMDYSAALIPLTKAIELILNYIFYKMDVSASIDNRLLSTFIKNGEKVTSLEMGSALYLLKDAQYINCSLDKNLAYGGNEYNDNSPFNKWNKDTSGKKIVDIEKLEKYKKIKIRVDAWDGRKKKNVQRQVSFKENEHEYNRMLLVKGLDFVREHYRNPTAHKDIVRLNIADEARKLLIISKNLIWILLDILN